MDTGIRLQRYIIQEIGGIAGIGWMKRGINISTALAVAAPLALALAPGDLAFGRLWALFGTTNQLTAGLALAVIAVWVMKRNRNPLAQVAPLAFLLVMTSYALLQNMLDFIEGRDVVLGSLNAIIAVLAAWLIVEATLALRAARRGDLEPVSQETIEEELEAQDLRR
jgi:carbon starvation protein